MKEKIDIALKIKERMLNKNLTLYSLEILPSEIYKNLDKLKRNFLILYAKKFYKPEIEILSPKKLLIKKKPDTPQFQRGDLCILILPFGNVRYIFRIKIVEENEGGFIGEIIDPRYDERISFKIHIPVFFSFIPPKFVNNLLNNPGFQLLRESNFLPESYQILKEIHVYDLIINENNNINDEFKKLIQKTFLVGELVDLSSGGLCARTKGQINITDDFGVFYLKFNFELSSKLIKFALFTYLRNISYKEDFTYFHLAFLVSLRKEFWAAIKGDLLNLSGQ